MKSSRPTEGTYQSACGVEVRVFSEPMPDSAFDTRQIIVEYGKAGPGAEQFYFDHEDQWPRARKIFDRFLRDIDTLGVPFRGTTAAQRDALAKARAARAKRRGKNPSATENLRLSPSASVDGPTPRNNKFNPTIGEHQWNT
jgi:hypothetical protein